MLLNMFFYIAEIDNSINLLTGPEDKPAQNCPAIFLFLELSVLELSDCCEDLLRTATRCLSSYVNNDQETQM